MTWDKDNPPAEFWGSDMQFGWRLWLLAVPRWFCRWATMAAIAALFGIIVSLLIFAEWWQAFLLVMIIQFGFLWASDRFLPTSTFLYYQFFDDILRIRVDANGPITLRDLFSRRFGAKTIRFTEDDVKALSVSQRPEYFPHVNKSMPAIRLTFTLLSGEAYRHSQLLDAKPHREHIANLRDFQALLDRLESALGPDRIETAASLKSAREALQRALQVKEAS